MEEEKIFLTKEQAIELLPQKEYIHTFMNPVTNTLIGADHSRESLIERITNTEMKIEVTGNHGRQMSHGMVLVGKYWRDNLFIETNMEILDSKYPETPKKDGEER